MKTFGNILLAAAVALASLSLAVPEAAAQYRNPDSAYIGTARTKTVKRQKKTRTAQKQTPYVADNARILKKETVAELQKSFADYRKETGITVGLLTVSGEKITGKYLSEFSKQYFFTLPQNESGAVLLVLNKQMGVWNVCFDNKIPLPNAMSRTLSELLKDPATKGDWDAVARTYFESVRQTVTETKAEAVRQQDLSYRLFSRFKTNAFLFALLPAVFLCYIVWRVLRSAMSNVRPVGQADDYLDTTSIEITGGEDTFVTTNRSIVPKIRTNPDGGGRGGGLRGGGGQF